MCKIQKQIQIPWSLYITMCTIQIQMQIKIQIQLKYQIVCHSPGKRPQVQQSTFFLPPWLLQYKYNTNTNTNTIQIQLHSGAAKQAACSRRPPTDPIKISKQIQMQIQYKYKYKYKYIVELPSKLPVERRLQLIFFKQIQLQNTNPMIKYELLARP